MKREIPPAAMVAGIVVVVALVVFFFWRSSVPAGVKTDKPPRVPPPGAGAALPAEPMAGQPAPPPGARQGVMPPP